MSIEYFYSLWKSVLKIDTGFRIMSCRHYGWDFSGDTIPAVHFFYIPQSKVDHDYRYSMSELFIDLLGMSGL